MRWTIERIRPRLPGGTDDVAASDPRSADPVVSEIGLSFGADAHVLDDCASPAPSAPPIASTGMVSVAGAMKLAADET